MEIYWQQAGEPAPDLGSHVSKLRSPQEQDFERERFGFYLP
ncbi:unnamed protein product [marine sediment metagenome]|uniref:Uncharacterized protein n=1 Tax=marine sediment metagenome TaxID=412755 RepID=X0X204_9ZZZZ